VNKQQTDLPRLSRKFLLLSLGLIILFGVLVYANSLKGQFLWDDEALVQYNPYIKDWSHLPKIFTSRLGSTAKEAGAFYRPVQTFSYLVDYSLWRLNVVGYHAVNILAHIGAALCLFWLIQIIFQNGKLSLMTALLFIVHPIHTEAISYVSGRADPLAAMFMLLAYIFYLKHNMKASMVNLGGMALSFLLALLSKELSLALPVLLLWHHYALKQPVNKKAFGTLIGVIVAYGLWRFGVVGSGTMTQGVMPTFGQRFPGIFVALTTYFRLLVLPIHLHMEYGGILFPFGEPKAILGMILFFGLIAVVWRRKEQDRFLLFAVGWFVITWLPSSNVFPINAYMAEHWLYLPSIGFFLLVSRFLAGWMDREGGKTAAVVIMVIILAVLSVMTVRQNRYWNNGINFYKRMLIYAPQSSRLYNNLAKAYHDAGMDDELVELLKSAITLQPDNGLAFNNLGNTYKSLGRFDEARQAYEKAIEIDSMHAGAYYNLSIIYTDIDKDPVKAVALLRKAIEISPYFSKAYNKLGLVYLGEGKIDKAIELLNKAVKLNPDDPEIYHNFGYIYVQIGRKGDAIAMYKKAIEVNLNYVEAYHDLAVLYVLEGNYSLAAQYNERAMALGYNDPQLVEALNANR